jgi:hypothetical protein
VEYSSSKCLGWQKLSENIAKLIVTVVPRVQYFTINSKNFYRRALSLFKNESNIFALVEDQ